MKKKEERTNYPPEKSLPDPKPKTPSGPRGKPIDNPKNKEK